MAQVDGKELSVELTRQFPEVPFKVIEDIMHKNSNIRELCLVALNIECQKFQENLYGAVSSCADVPPEGLQSNCAQGCDSSFERSDIQAIRGRHSDGSIGADNSGVGAPSLIPEPWLHKERPSIFHPSQVAYTPSQFSPISSLSSQPISMPPSNAAQRMVFTPPFVHPFNHPRDQGFYSPYFPVMPGTPFCGDSVFGGFGNRPRTFDPNYSQFQAHAFRSPYAGSPAIMRTAVNFPGSGTRSPIPFSPYQQNANYYPGAIKSLSTSQLHFGGGSAEEPTLVRHHLNHVHSGSSNIGTYHNQHGMLVGPQPQSSYIHAGLSQEDLSAAFEMLGRPAQQMSCPGSATSSRSGSLAGEDLAYTQALVGYQRIRLEAFLADLDRQKEMLDQLRKEVGQLQHESLDRRLSKSDVFPTAADRQKLLTENQNLEMEIGLLTYEIDLAFNGQSRLGWLDSEDQRFHDAISTGQFNQPVQLNHGTNAHPPHQQHHPQNSCPVIQQPSFTDNQGFRPSRPAPPPPPYSCLPLSNPVPLDSDEGENWSCSACTFLNHPLLNKCEFCDMPKLPATSSAR